MTYKESYTVELKRELNAACGRFPCSCRVYLLFLEMGF